jgi:hypothetical protein
VPHWSDVTTQSWASAGQVSVPLSRAPPSSFEGVARRPYESGRHSITELTLALPRAQCRIVAGMASSGGLAEQHRDMILRRVRGVAWRGFVFDQGACICHNIKCSGRWSRYGGGELVKASSEAETRTRGCTALERGEVSPEGATGP